MTVDVRYSCNRARLTVDDSTVALVDMQWQDDVILIRHVDPASKYDGELIGVAFDRHNAIQFAVAYLRRLGEAHCANATKRVRIGRIALRAA